MSAHERERLSAYLDGELTAAERAEVEAHLAACAACTALLATMGEVDDLARELPVEAPSGYFDAFPGRMRARIAREGVSPARAPRPGARWRPPVWTWAAAAALLLAVITPMTVPHLIRARISPREAPTAPAARPQAEVAETPPERAITTAGDEQAQTAPQRKRQAGPGRSDRDARTAEPEPPFALPPAPPPADAAPRPGREAGERDVPAVSPPAIAENRRHELRKDVATFAAAPSEGEALEEAVVADTAGRERMKADVVSSRAAPEPVSAGVASAPTQRAEVPPPPAAPAASLEAETRVGLAAAEKKADLSEDSLAFAELTRDVPRGAVAWRERREAWRAFIAEYPGSPHLDEARVRMIEAGLEAWKAGGDPADYTRARDDAASYLDREDASQKARVRRAIEDAEKR